jgi:hypothetical protein
LAGARCRGGARWQSYFLPCVAATFPARFCGEGRTVELPKRGIGRRSHRRRRGRTGGVAVAVASCDLHLCVAGEGRGAMAGQKRKACASCASAAGFAPPRPTGR